MHFSTYVLGANAADALRKKLMAQTIRSEKFLKENELRVGDVVQIFLDNVLYGLVKIASLHPVNLGDLTLLDCMCGGFCTLPELRKALNRAGFRFRKFTEYNACKIVFAWQDHAQEIVLDAYGRSIISV